MKSIYLLALAAAVNARAVARVASETGAGYDDLASSRAAFLSSGFRGVGQPLPPNPIMNIDYSSEFRVLKLGTGLFQILNAPTSPNVLLSPSITANSPAGSFGASGLASSFDVTSIYFACAKNILGFILPVPCSVAFEGVTSSGDTVQKTVAFAGRRSFAAAGLDFVELTKLSFTVTSVTSRIGEVSLLLDNFYYRINSEGPQRAPAKTVQNAGDV